jgi:hypothetical protein
LVKKGEEGSTDSESDKKGPYCDGLSSGPLDRDAEFGDYRDHSRQAVFASDPDNGPNPAPSLYADENVTKTRWFWRAFYTDPGGDGRSKAQAEEGVSCDIA